MRATTDDRSMKTTSNREPSKIDKFANEFKTEVSHMANSIAEVSKGLINDFRGSSYASKLAPVAASLAAIDASVRRKPWIYVAGVAGAAFTLGYLLSSRIHARSEDEEDVRKVEMKQPEIH